LLTHKNLKESFLTQMTFFFYDTITYTFFSLNVTKMAVISYKLYLVVQQAPRLLLKQHYLTKRDKKYATLNTLK
jgi:hypothetical protein